MKNIILIGFMGSGKSTVGKFVANNNNMKQIDTDWYIESKQNRKISEIFETDGEEAFRRMETDCIKELLKNVDNKYIVSVGGGLPMKEENRGLLHQLGTIVYLKAEISTLEKRLSGDKKRPLLQGGELHDKIASLMEKRESVYEELADIIVQTDNKSFEDIENEIKKGIE